MKLAAALFLLTACALAQQPTVLVITADTADYVLAAGGTLAAMAAKGSSIHVIRVSNEEKDAWELPPEEAVLRTKAESEAAARVLGVKEVISLGYRAGELADNPFTTLRDKLIFYIRHYKPGVLFLPNPYIEYERVFDRYHTGRAAEDAWNAAALENHLPPFTASGLKPHLVPEVYYFGQPVDPRRRDPESTETFVPQVKQMDIAGTLATKEKAAQALKTTNDALARRLKARLDATNRRLPALQTINDASINALVHENVQGLARLAAQGTSYKAAEEFRYAGLAYRIPAKYRRP